MSPERTDARAPAGPKQEQAARLHKEHGAALLARGKLDGALAAYEAAVEANPRDVTARRKVAEILVRLGRIQDALRAWQLLAGRLAAEGQLVQAIAACKVVLQLEPAHVETQSTLARLYAKQEVAGQERAERLRMPDSMSGAIELDHAPAARHLPKPRLALPGLQPLQPVEIVRSELPPAPLFSELPEEVMRALLERLALVTFAPGQDILVEGQTGRSLFVLASGKVEVARTLPSGERRVVDTMPEGSFFGEIGLVADVQRLATVTAVEECLVLEVTREVVQELARRFPLLPELVRSFYQRRLLANLLRVSPLFVPLTEAERRAVAARFVLRSAAPGEALLTQGQPGPGLFLLLRGRCAVSHRDAAGKEHALPELSEGAVMGEISLITGGPATATVTAQTRSVLLLLDPATFAEHVLANPAVREQITRLSAERLARTDAIVPEQAGAIEPALF